MYNFLPAGDMPVGGRPKPPGPEEGKDITVALTIER